MIKFPIYIQTVAPTISRTVRIYSYHVGAIIQPPIFSKKFL